VAADGVDLSQATIRNSPLNLASWPITTAIRVADLRPTGVYLDFSKRNGSDRWPDVTPPGWEGNLQWTLGMALYIGGRWYASAPVQFWYGLEESGGMEVAGCHPGKIGGGSVGDSLLVEDAPIQRGDPKRFCRGVQDLREGALGGFCLHASDETREGVCGRGDLIDLRECALLSDRWSVPRAKRNRSARPTRIGGFAKGARHEIKKATTLVVAQDTLSASSSRTSSPSSLLALGNHLLLATHCTVI